VLRRLRSRRLAALATRSRCLVVAIAAALVLCGPPSSFRAAGLRVETTHDAAGTLVVADELLVGLTRNAQSHADALRGSVGAARLEAFEDIDVEHWRLPPGSDVGRVLRMLATNPNVRFAEPNYRGWVDSVPDDPLRAELYGLHNIGQTGGVPDADVDALEAWQVTTGSPDVVVAVLDSGVDYTHPDLAANSWKNPREVPANGLDDDANGYVDDTRGWDFVDGDNDPMDEHYHGTHTAGIVAAVGDNGVGVIGVAWHARILPIRWLDASGSGTTDRAIAAVLYAASLRDDAGRRVVRIMSNSWRIAGDSVALRSAIESSHALFVASAGNAGGSTPQYPAGYGSANIVAVAATDHADALASFSNFGSTWVDLGAPGLDVVSCSRDGTYCSMSGTSMSAPYVAGAAALVLSQRSTLRIAALKRVLLDSVDPLPALAGITRTGGRLNAANAVRAEPLQPDTVAPGAIAELSATPVANDDSAVDLSFTATGDDGGEGAAYCYDVRYSTSPIGAETFAEASPAAGESSPAAAGVPETLRVSRLTPNVTCYVAVRVLDEAGNAAPIAVTSVAMPPNAWSCEVIDADGAGLYKWLAFGPDGRPAIAYSTSTNALKLATSNGSSWTVETVARGEDAKTGVSLAFDPVGTPTISYGWGALKVARRTGACWAVSTVEPAGAYNVVTCIAFDRSGSATVSYGTNGGLKVARAVGAEWTTEVIDHVVAPRYTSLAFDPATGEPAVAYSAQTGVDSFDTLKLARSVGGVWRVEVVATGVAGYGVFASLAFDPVDGNPSIVHRTAPGISFLHWNGASWDTEYVDSGSCCSLVYGPDGAAYVAYVDRNVLKFARRDGPGSWTSRPVDASNATWADSTVPGLPRGLEATRLGYAAWVTSPAFGPDGCPAIAYQEYAMGDLMLARRRY
jgi:subtilisin family serine protease